MKKYIITFLITSSIFLSAFFVSDRINLFRVKQLHNVQEKISLSILSTETRFALLKESSCENVFEGSKLEIGITEDLNNLVTRIKFLESELGGEDENVKILKQRYTLLQIKDLLLVQELSKKCNYTIATVIYFHSEDCLECKKQSIVLDKIRSENTHVRVYWMDTSINESTLETLARLNNVTEYPTLVLGEDTYSGFISYDEFSQELAAWAEKHDPLVEVRPTDDLVSLGQSFIQGLDTYSEIDIKDIVFVEALEDTYVYMINNSNKDTDEPQDVLYLELDSIVNKFNLVDSR